MPHQFHSSLEELVQLQADLQASSRKKERADTLHQRAHDVAIHQAACWLTWSCRCPCWGFIRVRFGHQLQVVGGCSLTLVSGLAYGTGAAARAGRPTLPGSLQSLTFFTSDVFPYNPASKRRSAEKTQCECSCNQSCIPICMQNLNGEAKSRQEDATR